MHEYVVVYAKNKQKLPRLYVPRSLTDDAGIITALQNVVSRTFEKDGQKRAQEILQMELNKYKKQGMSWLTNYRCVDENGAVFYPQDLSVPGEPNDVRIPSIGLYLQPLPARRWSSENKFISLYEAGRLAFLNGRPYEKHFLSEAVDSISSILPFYSRQGTEDLKRLGCGGLFDTPKPVKMIELFVMAIAYSRDKVNVLDFFAGSGTTGQAVYQAQQKFGDTKQLTFDLVQLNEDMRRGTRPYKTAQKLHIKPNIAEALKFRLDTFLQQNNMPLS